MGLAVYYGFGAMEHRRPQLLQALRIHFLQLVLVMWSDFMHLMIVETPSK